MADLGPALVTGSATLVGVVAGAGLTYWLGALNRRHQEQREDKTRWYEARLQAYTQLTHAIDDMTTLLFHPEKSSPEARSKAMEDLRSAQSRVRLVGSTDFYDETDDLTLIATRILNGLQPPMLMDKDLWTDRVLKIEHLARQDLGYPDTQYRLDEKREQRQERKQREKRTKKQ